MRGKLTIILLVLSLVFASAALAASSAPVGGGHYKGSDNAKTRDKAGRSVKLAVTRNRANFASGLLNFVLEGHAVQGSCAGPAYVSLSPTHARQISKAGTFNLHGSFTFQVPTPHGGLTYKASVTITGGFSDHGQKVSGTLRETARHNNFSCHSATVHFSASLTK
ncbi:MAG: hypothetical protein ABI323_04120 [Solirubrobacteraceae bacterium]